MVAPGTAAQEALIVAPDAAADIVGAAGLLVGAVIARVAEALLMTGPPVYSYSVAVMLGVAVTAFVPTLNVWAVASCGTVTLPAAGTVASLVLLLVRYTGTPPVGPHELRLTVPSDSLPPITDAGFSVTPDIGGTISKTKPLCDVVLPKFAIYAQL